MNEIIMNSLIKHLFPQSAITKNMAIMLVVFSAALLTPHTTLAACTGTASNSYFDFGSTIVQRDLPVGSVIATAKALNTVSNIISCTTVTPTMVNKGALFSIQSPIAGAYNTNIPGVGINFVASAPGWLPSAGPTIMSGGRMDGYLMAASLYQLIKTGPIPSGVYNLDSGLFLTHSVNTFGDAFRANISSGTVTSVACSLNNNAINVPLDDVMAASLTAVGSVAKPKTFDMGLTCDAGAKVNVQMNGTQNTNSSVAGVLQLTNAGSPGVAKGVGVQILYNGSPLALNNRLLLKTSAGGQETFTFTARYYQTQSVVTTGAANTTMTLEVTYQ